MNGDAYYLLIVDDQPEVGRLLSDFLKDEGYTVKTACNGDQAISAINAQIPSMILMDISKPGYSGLGILKEVQDLVFGVPVFVITGNAKPDVIAEAKKIGLARYFISKPFDVFSLIQLVTQIVPPLPRALAI